VAHAAVNVGAATYRTGYLSEQVSAELPAQPCALTVSELLRAILAEFSRLNVRVPQTPQERNMAQVALDQILASRPVVEYLPIPGSAFLQRLADDMSADLGPVAQ
jgi:hypothetical protein